MSKSRFLEPVTPEGETGVYQPQASLADFNLSQQFSHEHTEQAVEDIVGSPTAQVAGFDIIVSTGVNTAATIKAPGRVYQPNGTSFELADDTLLDVAAANNQSRIDLIYALLEEDAPAATGVRPYGLLRSLDQQNAGAPANPLIQVNHPQERHNRATVGIRTGTPDLNPLPPALQSNEVALYLVKVGKGVTTLSPNDVIDVRNKLTSLYTVSENLRSTRSDVARIDKRLSVLPDEILLSLQGLFGTIGEVRSLQEILADLLTRFDHLSLPEVIRPKIDPWDSESGKISATGGVDGSIPIVDIELNTTVAFGDRNVTLNPRRFADKSRLARFFKISGGAASEQHSQNLTLSDVTDVQSDGSGDFVQRAATLPVRRSRAACAARDDRYIEIFGGLGENNTSKLGDWYTYDVVNDTLTARTLTGDAIPNADRAYMFPCGDGVRVLLCAGASGGNAPHWYLVNTATWVATQISGTVPPGNHFFGDSIAESVIFIVATDQVSANEQNATFWTYSIDEFDFIQIFPGGNVPVGRQDYSSGCYYRKNEFVLVEFTPDVPASGKTYVYNLQSNTWTQLSIGSPYGGTDTQLQPISRFRMANVNGRPLFVGGLITNVADPDAMRVWELSVAEYSTLDDARVKRPRWTYYDTDIPPLADAALCSTVPVDSFVARGGGFLIAGQSGKVEALNKIYASMQGGLIETVLDGVTGLTLADSSTFASFVVPAYTASWQVAGYVASLDGQYAHGQYKLEVSFNGGTQWHEVTPDKVFAVADSSTPAHRHVRITLYSFKTSKPIVTALRELFDQNGAQIDERNVLRFNAITAGVRGLYLTRDGQIRLEDTIVPSTPDKALLLKITPTGSSTAPTVLAYTNKRHGHVRYRDTVGIGVPHVPYDLAVLPSYVRLLGVAASDKHLYDADDPDIAFDEQIDIEGVTAADDYLLELEW
jgi:hypothetical protein